MPDLADLFPGYESRWIETSGGRIFARVSDGGGPPLLLLHGHPQSNVSGIAIAVFISLIVPML
jgi:haloacetate dehalogenase